VTGRVSEREEEDYVSTSLIKLCTKYRTVYLKKHTFMASNSLNIINRNNCKCNSYQMIVLIDQPNYTKTALTTTKTITGNYLENTHTLNKSFIKSFST